MPLQQYDSYGSGGPTQGGSGSHESRTFTYGFTDVTSSYSGDSNPEYYENLYPFYGNLRGQICRKYEPGKLIAGAHTWHFDGKDMRGNALPSGVYLVKMEIPGQNIVKRISLSK
jgi:flagellar hook assembly protein FlgD